jgi:hypothetical protein
VAAQKGKKKTETMGKIKYLKRANSHMEMLSYSLGWGMVVASGWHGLCVGQSTRSLVAGRWSLVAAVLIQEPRTTKVPAKKFCQKRFET